MSSGILGLIPFLPFLTWLGVIVYVIVLLTPLVHAVERIADSTTPRSSGSPAE